MGQSLRPKASPGKKTVGGYPTARTTRKIPKREVKEHPESESDDEDTPIAVLNKAAAIKDNTISGETSGTDTEEEDADQAKLSANTVKSDTDKKVDEAKTTASTLSNDAEPKELEKESLAIKEEDTDAPSQPEMVEEPAKKDPATIAAIIDSTHAFPQKLLELLQNDVDPEAICWLPDEESFRINKKLFEERILNRYFRGNKYTSITRNLNRWGFRRIFSHAGEHIHAYRNNLFKKKVPELVKMMKEDKKGTEGSKGGRKPKAEGSMGPTIAGQPAWGSILSPSQQALQQQQQMMWQVAFMQGQQAMMMAQYGQQYGGVHSSGNTTEKVGEDSKAGNKKTEKADDIAKDESKPKERSRASEGSQGSIAPQPFPPMQMPAFNPMFNIEYMHRMQLQMAHAQGAPAQQIVAIQQQQHIHRQQLLQQQAFMAHQMQMNQQAAAHTSQQKGTIGSTKKKGCKKGSNEEADNKETDTDKSHFGVSTGYQDPTQTALSQYPLHASPCGHHQTDCHPTPTKTLPTSGEKEEEKETVRKFETITVSMKCDVSGNLSSSKENDNHEDKDDNCRPTERNRAVRVSEIEEKAETSSGKSKVGRINDTSDAKVAAAESANVEAKRKRNEEEEKEGNCNVREEEESTMKKAKTDNNACSPAGNSKKENATAPESIGGGTEGCLRRSGRKGPLYGEIDL